MYKEIGKFYVLPFAYLFSISRVVSLRREVLSFKQKEKESLGATWACFNDLVNSSPDLAIQDHMLLQHFYMGLSGETA